MATHKTSKRTHEAINKRNTKPHVYLVSCANPFLVMLDVYNPSKRALTYHEQDVDNWVTNVNIDRDRGVGSWAF